MASERQTGVSRKGGEEHDAFSPKARAAVCAYRKPGVAKSAKRSYNRRVRRGPVVVEMPETPAKPLNSPN